jgi:RNA polymerase sigma-70 factor (ECF subfamily)
MSDSEIARDMFLFTTAAAPAPGAAAARPEVRLVERVIGGDREAFDQLYKLFAPLVHGIALSRVPYDEAQDVVQDVFLAAYRNLHTLRDKAAFGAWLARIARNQSAEYYRHPRPAEELTDDIRDSSDHRGEAREILTTIRTMPAAYRETLILRLVEGMTGDEIADQTGLTPDSVRVNLHRGMRMLRQRLGIEEMRK